MKKLLFVLALAPCLAHAELKVATADLLLLVRHHPDYARNEKFMETKSRDLQKKTDAIKSEGESLQDEGKKLIDEMRNPMLNDKAKADAEKRIQEIQQQLIQIEQRYRAEVIRSNQELQEDRARLTKATTDDLRARMKAFAEKEGYDLILDATAAVYAKESFDVTPALLKEMGVDPKAAESEKE